MKINKMILFKDENGNMLDGYSFNCFNNQISINEETTTKNIEELCSKNKCDLKQLEKDGIIKVYNKKNRKEVEKTLSEYKDYRYHKKLYFLSSLSALIFGSFSMFQMVLDGFLKHSSLETNFCYIFAIGLLSNLLGASNKKILDTTEKKYKIQSSRKAKSYATLWKGISSIAIVSGLSYMLIGSLVNLGEYYQNKNETEYSSDYENIEESKLDVLDDETIRGLNI